MPDQTSARAGLASVRGKNLDELRRSNLSLALGLIHRRGRLARSELTRELGLNRSTIAALVSELVARGLAVESMPTATGHVGRPSLTITPSPSIAAIAVRPEVDAVTIALVGLGGRVVREVRYDTSGVPSAREVATIVRAIVEGMAITESMSYDIHGVGLAIPGLVRASDGLVVFAPHLGWRDEPLARKLAEQTGFEVRAANDALCGTLAEFTFGAGQGATDMVYLHGGPSGIGGGIVVDGSLVSGAHGYAGELGHTLVNSHGALCHCGATGCLEAEVRREPLLAALGLGGAHADSLRPALQGALDSGTRPDVAALVRGQATMLAIALRNAVNTFNTRRVVLGGFLGDLFALEPEPFESLRAGTHLLGAQTGIEIVEAQLGHSAALLGAAELVFRPLLDDPTMIGTAERRGAAVSEVVRLRRHEESELAV